MLGKSFIIGLLLMPSLSLAQSLSKRSEPIHLEVKPGKTPRTYLGYEDVRFEDTDGNHTIEPAEQTYIRFKITNRSKAESQRLYVTASLAENLPGLQVPEPIGLHPVGPEKSFAVEIPLLAGSDVGPGVAVLFIEIREADVFEADVIQLNVLTSGGITADRKRNR